jgi:hypothetical protein
MANAKTTGVTGSGAMRHDPVSAAVVVMLRGLNMHGMAQAPAA